MCAHLVHVLFAHVVLEVLAVAEGLATDVTLEVVDVGVQGEVRLEVVAGREALPAVLTAVRVDAPVCVHVAASPTGGRERLAALLTHVGTRQLVLQAQVLRGDVLLPHL